MAIQIVSCTEFDTLTQEVNDLGDAVTALQNQPTLYKDKAGVDLPAGSKVAVPTDVDAAITTAVGLAANPYKDKSGAVLPNGSKVAVPADVTDGINTAVNQAALLDKTYVTTAGATVPNNGVVLTPIDLNAIESMLPSLCQDVVTVEDGAIPTYKFQAGDTLPLVTKDNACYLVVEIDGQMYRLIAERVSSC